MKKLEGKTLTAEQQKFFNDKVAYISTVDRDGNPQIGPKESLNVLDENHLVYVEVTHAHAFNNIKAGSKVAAVVADVPSHTAVRVIGTPHISEDAKLTEEQRNKTGKNGTVVVIDVDEIDA